ncbi:phylloplanin-like protein [Trifolium pratense]|uniref:Phylloplanin-like protein n=1 Tax=Trifolium pratense TaxID=57577 RepID=A0A2K3P621_TRIPR|nr:phylloplanin-like protein [Trifolium pratense]
MAIPQTKAQLGILNDLLGSANIKGTVLCTSKDNVGAATPGFSNAQVQLQCGGNMVSNATTDNNGKFSMMMDNPLLYDLSSLLTSCNLMVPTPLSNCNTKLPSAGGLISTLKYVGISHIGTQTLANIAPSGFHFIPLT